MKYSGDECLVSADGDFYDLDIDTPEDYQTFMRSLGSNEFIT